MDLQLANPKQLPHGEYLSVRVRLLVDGRQVAECRKGFGFLSKRDTVDAAEQSPFGLLVEQDQWPLCTRLGARAVRPNWNWDERPMEWAARYRILYCPLMNEANGFVRGDLTEREYVDFIGTSVSRFKNYVHYWQLGNEFDVFHRDGPKAYVESQRLGYPCGQGERPKLRGRWRQPDRASDPSRGGLPSRLNLGWPNIAIVYDFHFYADLATTQDLLDYIHATCKRLKAEKPIWVTETTQFGMFDNDDRNQADYVFKRFSHLLSNGVTRVFWHALTWPYPYSADKIQATALIDYEGFARPSLFAYAAMTRELAGGEICPSLVGGPGRLYNLSNSCAARGRS